MSDYAQLALDLLFEIAKVVVPVSFVFKFGFIFINSIIRAGTGKDVKL